ncbi:MAG TPA: lipocalin-like domain-containing protein [Desulfomonilaceae bacterium]|nr:lipocalin-like domain-containing protein [Desulfomonilaceae bacterium]
MSRLVFALALILLVTYPSFGQQSLVGTYKMVSQTVETGGTPDENMGKAPKGWLILTPKRAIAFYTAENRKFGTTEADKAALFDSMGGWSATYRVEGSKIVFSVDASWIENWNGTNVVRNWQLSSNRLTLTSDPQPFARDPSKMVIIRQVWEKTE